MASAKHKRGDTFDRSGVISVSENGAPVADLTGWTGASQMRNARGLLLAQLTFTWLDASLRLARLTAPDGTSAWPVGELKMDIELTSPSGFVVSTETATIEIVPDVTHG